MPPPSIALLASGVVGFLLLSACATSVSNRDLTSSGVRVLEVAASINAWGSILAQLGGTHVHETSIITNPATDPHSYEPTARDGRVIARSRLFVANGVGYDSWAAKALAASSDPSRDVITVGTLVHVSSGGNPHRWYSPADVETVSDTITADLKRLDPADAGYFDAQRAIFENTGLAQYHQLIDTIRTRYARTPVGASESIFAPLADALGLNLLTPPEFLKATSEGSDPSPRDKATSDAQISRRQIKVYVYNSQNATPDVTAQVNAARANGIPVTTITETLTPANVTFQQWQSAQLHELLQALTEATGR